MARLFLSLGLRKRREASLFGFLIFQETRKPALEMIRLWCKDTNIELIKVLTVTDADRGEGARNREELLHKAFELGVSFGKYSESSLSF
ncbi:MAG: hypothetical protein ACUVQY_07810 [Thermoproteota archaeon]